MTLRKLFLLFIGFVCSLTWAQNDSIYYLQEVQITDMQLQKFSNSQSVQKLSDSVMQKNQSSLTSLLNFNSVIYFKENGLGMVSSPSFRGTTAQQTAVIWNGININSQLNGQTDFNTITTRDFSEISVRAGGGSSIYGSSAIGGSIHLNNTLNFNHHFDSRLRLQYGSFNTFDGNYSISASNGKASTQVSISRNSSDNDYEYVASGMKNNNGQFYNSSISVSFGYKINESNYLKFHSQFFDSERHFSVLFPSETKTKYQDFNTRNLLEWVSFFGRFTARTKVAALSERYKYFSNIESESYTFGDVKTYLGKYDLTYNAHNNLQLNAIVEYAQNSGEGSDIKNEKRTIGAASLLMKHFLTGKFLYELSFRKEFTENYESPFLFSVGTNYDVADFYTLKINGSKNFRIPTFNDLYWQPGGNENLKPESSYQAEIGNVFSAKNLKFTLTGYYIAINDMLRWIPTGANWSPQNTHKVNTYGLEVLFNYTKNINNHHFIFNATYAYTVSEDKILKKQLIYVPFHKANSSLAYSWKKFVANYQFLYNGEVFTRSDNNSRYNVASYVVSNVLADYDFGKKNPCVIGFQVFNIFNENYASVENRFLPGRNYAICLTLNF